MKTQYRLYFTPDGGIKCMEKRRYDEGKLVARKIKTPLTQEEAMLLIEELGRRGYEGGMCGNFVSIFERY